MSNEYKLKLIDIVKMHEIRIQTLENELDSKTQELNSYKEKLSVIEKKYSFLIDFISEINNKLNSS